MFPARLPPRLLALLALPALLAACDRTAPAASTHPALRTPAATAADPAGRIEASMARFRSARSFAAEMTLQGPQRRHSRLEYVAPDRYRLQLSVDDQPLGTQVIVGDTLYLQADAGTRRVPLPPGLLAQWRDPLQLQPGERLQVEDLGPDPVDGRAAHKYRVRHPDTARPPMSYWIDADGWPLRIEQAGRDARGDYRLGVTYSRFDDPSLRIDPPAGN